jgi:hypothetical protein
MRYMIVTLFLISAAAIATAPYAVGSWQSFGGASGEAPVVSVLESDQSHMIVQVSLPGFWLYDVPAGGSAWDRIELPECYSQGALGLPDVPSTTSMFALPFGTTARVSIENVITTSFDGLSVLPRQTPDIDMDHAPFAFVQDPGYYADPRPYPSSWFSVDGEAVWSGLNVARLVVNPFRFDPASRELTVATEITLRVSFAGTASVAAEPVNPDMIPSMEETIINWDAFSRDAVSTDELRAGAEYIVVCNADNVSYVEELFTLHHYLGLHTVVEQVANPADPGLIFGAIADNYETGVTRFALLVGDHTVMPSFNYGSHVGDYYYACITGGDDLPEIAVGRLTGSNDQIAHQVDKIIDGYMTYNFADGNTTGIIPSETVLAAHEEQYPGKYTQCCNEIAAYPYSQINFTFTKVYPPEGGTAAMVSNAINAGNGVITYRGHGDVTYWAWSPGWTSVNIDALTNSFMPPVFNIACYNGRYSDGTICLSESWQWAVNGASGNLGANDPSYTEANHTFIKEIYKAAFDQGIFAVAEAVNASTVITIAQHGTYGLANARMYIWFGDPAQELWTFDAAGEPGSLSIDAPATIPSGSQDVTITVTDDGSPVPGVLVTLTDGVDGYSAMTFYAQGTTDGSGQAVINITAPTSGIVHAGAWLHDYEYDLAELLITTGVEGSPETPVAFSLDMPLPNPVTFNASLGFSVPTTGRIELAVYDVSGRMIETLLDGSVEAGEHSVSWTPGVAIANGVYFIRLSAESGTLTRQAMVIR